MIDSEVEVGEKQKVHMRLSGNDSKICISMDVAVIRKTCIVSDYIDFSDKLPRYMYGLCMMMIYLHIHIITERFLKNVSKVTAHKAHMVLISIFT